MHKYIIEDRYGEFYSIPWQWRNLTEQDLVTIADRHKLSLIEISKLPVWDDAPFWESEDEEDGKPEKNDFDDKVDFEENND